MAFYRYRLMPDYPGNTSATVELPGLHDTVRVYIDSAGAPHIDASNEEDLLRAAGFFQGRDRFFEMDVLRRIARGRISELVGDRKLLYGSTVLFDLAMRGWGFDEAVENEVMEMNHGMLVLFQAFTGGINHALELHTPLEYRLLGVNPEPWKIADSFAVGYLNAWGVTHNWQQETFRLLLALHGGIDRAEKIYGHRFWQGGSTLPSRDEFRRMPPAVARELREFFPRRPYSAGRDSDGTEISLNAADALAFTAASNSWVLAGNRTSSGKPLLANDPHMAHLLPSLMYQLHLSAPGIDVIGATIPGLPYVLSGHNRYVAWGITSAVADAVDLFIEQVNPHNPGEYRTSGGFEAFRNQEHAIFVRDGGELKERRFVVRKSRHGAVMNDMYPDLFPPWAPPVAIHWKTGGARRSIEGLRQVNRARSVEMLREEAQRMRTPVMSWVAGDTDGAIGFFTSGSIPVRMHHRGTFPVPGWLERYEWKGMHDPDNLPFQISREGFFVHANNLVTDPEHDGILFHIDTAPSYRMDRIRELLQAEATHDRGTVSSVQCDSKLLRATRIVPVLLHDLESAQNLDEGEREMRELLRSWDCVGRGDSPAALLFFLTYRMAVERALEDEVDRAGFTFILSQRYSTNVFDMWFDSSDHVVWDHRGTPLVETRADAVVRAFKAAAAKITNTGTGKDDSPQHWGARHFQRLEHLFGSNRMIAGYLNLPAHSMDGGLSSVWKSHFDLGNDREPFRVIAGPVYRMIVDCADMDHGLWIIDTGSSGWPGSPHYDDQYERWRRCEYLPMVSAWDEIRSDADAVITLQ
jgi:penicillin amidase